MKNGSPNPFANCESLGNLLIIQRMTNKKAKNNQKKPNLLEQPNDSGLGGCMKFVFKVSPMNIFEVGLLDPQQRKGKKASITVSPPWNQARVDRCESRLLAAHFLIMLICLLFLPRLVCNKVDKHSRPTDYYLQSEWHQGQWSLDHAFSRRSRFHWNQSNGYLSPRRGGCFLCQNVQVQELHGWSRANP